MLPKIAIGALEARFVDYIRTAPATAAPALAGRDPDALLAAIISGEEPRTRGLTASSHAASTEIWFTDLCQARQEGFTARKMILLDIPRGLAEARGLSPRALHGTIHRSGRSTLLAFLLTGALVGAPKLTGDDGALLEGVVLRLLSLAVAGSVSPRRIGGRRASASSPARSVAEHEFEPAELSVSKLCRHLKVSRSTLYRLFREEGGVSAYIRRRRLEAVRRDLENPLNTEPVYLLAERHGFVDTSHLNRLFRVRYGTTPGDWRARYG